jgi:hypothetical protein
VYLRFFKKIGKVGGWSQLSSLATAATNRPIVPAPGDYDDGEIGGMIGKGNRIWICRIEHVLLYILLFARNFNYNNIKSYFKSLIEIKAENNCKTQACLSQKYNTSVNWS